MYHFHKQFWQLKNAVEERAFIQKCLTLHTISRIKVKTADRKREQCNYTIEYFIQTSENRIRVCKESFLPILSVGRSKVKFAAKTFFNAPVAMKEMRGCKKPILSSLKEKVIKHIKTFKVRERNYGQNDTVCRVYLPPELSIKRMHMLFLKLYPDFGDCKYTFHYEVFRSNFNLGFGTIKKDTCSTCLNFTNSLKNTDEYLESELRTTKKELMVEHHLHKLQYKCFFIELNTHP